MFPILLFASLAFVSQSQHAVYHPGYHPRAVYVNPVVAPVRYTAPLVKAAEDESPKPYSYSYEAPAEGGASSRQETSDGSGRVTGSYSLADEDGRSRVVEYFADETGFHANVRTNEPGTANQSPADVNLESTAPEAAPVYASAKPAPAVPAAVDTRIVAPAPLTYNIAPVNRALYYSPTHRHGLYDNRHGLYDGHHGLYNRGLYSPYGLYGHNHGVYGGHYGNHGIYGNHGLYGHNRGYYPRYYY